MKKLILLLLLLNFTTAQAQVAIIQDKDGFTSVREKPSSKAQIIHQLKPNEVFWYNYDENNANGDWVAVFIPTNKYSLNGNLCSTQPYFTGYIHKSKLLPLDKLKPYTSLGFTFHYSTKKFDPNSHYIDYRDGKIVTAVDGRHPWGTDGNMPVTEVEAMVVSVNGKSIDVPKHLYMDIFECDNEFQVYENGDTYFVHQWNSDGAGAYEIVWVLTNWGLTQRLVGNMI
ncbi:hypothetical protein [Pontibacter mangrovi]|uniref:SH3 domain-containing protein n=1 Tax=Pontibacter mangrovi TaxID=2589816 RepID=A0A501WCF3_9BACT|nr:hypothetical protein [Pontibacter mangrovi]TPE44901.1 hypothetical protein FJM65_07750 [Pontibacter mangrovi]